jgi:hypothetical protein
MKTDTLSEKTVTSPVAVAVPLPLVERVKETLEKVKGLKGEALRIALVDLCNVIHLEKPEKVVFSSDRATRKAQMGDFKRIDNVWRQSLALVFRVLDESGNAESKTRFSGSVSSGGIVTIRQNNALALKPLKSGRITL